MKITIVGGGSAGWMSAAALIKSFPNYEIVLIESETTPKIGVGESTINGIRQFCNYLEIDEKDFLSYTDGSYKLSIKFRKFYNGNLDDEFIYPFGLPDLSGTAMGLQDWMIKKYCYPETPNSDFAECYFPAAIMSRKNKFFKNTKYDFLDSYDSDLGLAYHFDAIKFSEWLKNIYCIPRGVENIVSDVNHIEVNGENIEFILLGNGKKITSDLFIDCTGFQSLILGKHIKEKFIDFSDMLPNNRAWATQIDYINKEQEIEPFTNCTAINNGWVWNIPLWSRIGTGYVYSDKYISPEDALKEFQEYLCSTDMAIPRNKGYIESLSFKDISMRVGIHERTWVGNVVAIGLSAGFIEPLESNGLYTVHEFLFKLIKSLKRGEITRWERDSYNIATFKMFNEFAEFVALHYALSVRKDTEYWKDISEKSFISFSKQRHSAFDGAIEAKTYTNMAPVRGGYSWIFAGMNYLPLDSITAQLGEMEHPDKYEFFYKNEIDFLNNRKLFWENFIDKKESLYSYLRKNIYS